MDWFKKNWKFLTIVLAAVLVLTVAIFALKPDEQVSQGPTEGTVPPDGAETGVYYFETPEGEYVLSFNTGNVFTIAGPTLNKSGKYTVTANGFELDFIRDEDGTGTITKDGTVLTLQYNNKTLRFVEKVTYAVSFNSNGGSAVESVDVLNGKTVAKPADPQKDGSVFIGWYADEACTQLYDFSANAITANTTVYAKWAEPVVGQNEYMVDFDLGYEAEGYEAMTTVGGKLYNIPTPEREGYTFAGWWVSMTEQADQLTFMYTEELVFQANTTLFAQWQQAPAAGALEAPQVEVFADVITWNTIKGASTYNLKITSKDGQVLVDEPVGTTKKNYNFNELAAGEYTIEVTAIGSTNDKTSETTVRHYVNKALNRVSLFTVIDGGILLWNGVEGAEKYLVTVCCGDEQHAHKLFDNGSSTTYYFGGCAMQPGGITFTVTAVANGKADSVSETFVYEKNLDSVGQIMFNEETQSFYWSSVANASKYVVTYTINGESVTVDNGASTSFSVKNLSGEITVSVVPATKGYNAPEASTATYTKTTLATPSGLTMSGTTVRWDAVEGANGYMVKINGQAFSCEANTMNLSELSIELLDGVNYEICVMAIGATNDQNSLYSDAVTTRYQTKDIQGVTYKNNTVSWIPVLGVSNYQVRLNGHVVANVSDTDHVQISLNQPGVNVIEVRYTDLGGSNWSSTEVYAYEVVYNTRSASGIVREYVAIGDALDMPTSMSMDGYEFTGWYNSPNAAAGNGAAFNDQTFSGNDTLMLYGNWTAKTYYVEFIGLGDTNNMTEGQKQGIQYLTKYNLPVPVNPNAGGDFVGWYTEPNGGGMALTDSFGNSLTKYTFTRNTYAYPFFDIGVLSFELQADDTYAVTKGPNLANASKVRIPEYYKGKPVTTILENAFYGTQTIEILEIPATIKVIGTGAIPTYAGLKEINVYTDVVQTNYEVFYSSHEGALLRHDMGTVFLEAFPRGKTGTYVIPDHVNVIRDKVFRFAQINKLVVGNGVTTIMADAFYHCSSLRTLEFKGEGTDPLTIHPNAFYNTNNLTTIRLPARVNEFDLQILNTFARLTTIEVEEGGLYYSSNNNTITNAAGDAILYAPTGIAGEYTIPTGIYKIGEQAFVNRPNITKLTIPVYVDQIGYGAFQGCTGITEVVIEGGRNGDLLIDQQAFTGCASLKTITFKGNGTGTADKGTITIGNMAFTALPELTTLIFEAGVNVVIGDSAFGSNAKLENPIYNDGANIISIGNSSFANCIKFTEAFIPASTTHVDAYAYSGCTNIEQVIFAPNGQNVTFGGSVFSGCARLTKVTLPSTLSSFDATVFASCSALRDIIVDEANPNFMIYEGALYTKDGSEILFYPKQLDGDLSKLHPNLQKIGNAVFKSNLNITSVNLSNKVTYIGNEAFYGCTNLSSVTIAQDGTALEIGSKAFYNCSKLTAIELPDYTSSIGTYAFYKAALKSFKVPASLTELSAHLLEYTKITTIHIPANVEKIGDAAFSRCSSMTSITFEEGTKPLTIGTLECPSVSSGVFFNTHITTVDLPDRVTLIGAWAFCNQTYLRTVNMTADSQLTTIGKWAFAQQSGTNSKLNSVTLGPKVTEIQEYAFHRTKIANITIPKSVTFIGQYAFAYAPMTGLNFEMDGATDLSFDLTIQSYAFANTQTTSVKFPARLTSAYELIDLAQWGASGTAKNFYLMFTGNEVLASIDVEEGCKNYYAKDGILYERDDYGEPTILLYCPRAKTGSVTVPKEVRKVENGAFANSSLTSVIFEEYAKTDAEYGKPLLELGYGRLLNSGGTPPQELAVFCPNGNAASGGGGGGGKDERSVTRSNEGALSRIQLPSHLGVLGYECFRNLTAGNVDGGGSGGGGKDERAITRSSGNGIVIFNMDCHLTAIEGRAFDSCSGITELILPSVDSLGIAAFNNMTNVTAVSFGPESQLKTLPNNLLQNCTKLTTFNVPASVTKIGEQVFSGCSSLTSITFEEGSQLSEIGARCFQNTGLTTITLPQTVSFVGEYAFYRCYSLKTVNLSKFLAFVSKATFYECVALEAINVPDDNQYLSSTDGVVYDLAKTVLYAYPQGKDPANFTLPDTLLTIDQYSMAYFPGENLVLPESLEKIGNYAFESSSLKVLHIPKNVKSIGEYAFYQRSLTSGKSLEVLTFAPDSVLKTISKAAFRANIKLKELDLPDSIVNIGYEAFSSSYELETVMMPAALQDIGDYAFYNCPSIGQLTFQQNVDSIGISAFAVGYNSGMPKQTLTELVIPATVSTIKKNAFERQTALKNITFAEGCRLSSLGTEVFAGCASLESIVLPASLSTIAKSNEGGNMGNGYVSNMTYYSGLFENCTSLKSVDMSACAGLRDLSGRMFQGCVNLETLILPPNVTTIGDHFFGTKSLNNHGNPEVSEGLISLKEIVIPASVTSLGGYAFNGCTSLETVIFAEGSALTNLGSTTYDPNKPWHNSNVFANTPALKNVVLPQNLTVIGTSCFENSAIENVDLPSSIITIGDCAFKNCANLLDAGMLPNLQYLGDEAFFGCEKMQTAELSFGLEYLGSMAFAYCKSLKRAHIPATVTSISGNPFMGCTSVESFDMDPDNVNFTVDENGVLYDRQMYTLLYYPASLTAETFEIPDTVHEIAPGAFTGAQLKSLVVPNQITAIPEYAFAGSAIESVTLHANVTSIGDHAFDGCAALNNFVVPNTVKQLGDYAFANCTALTNFTFEDIIEGQEGYNIGEHFFDGCTAMTQVILPNALIFEGRDGIQTDCIPSYMFANTGIVNAVIPARVTDLETIGVFYNCKQLVTVDFETKYITGYSMGALYFYGCSSLKEIEIPAGMMGTFEMINGHSEPGLYTCGNYIFGECTSLEKVTVYIDTSMLSSGMFTFYNCSSLKEINVLHVGELVYDDKGNVVDYASVLKHCFSYINPGAFWGCSSLQHVDIYSAGLNVYGNAFAGTAIEVLHFEVLHYMEGYAFYGFDDRCFADTPNLKQIFIGQAFNNTPGFRFGENVFTDIEGELSVYFYNYTYEEVVALCEGDMAWYENASENVTFYFRDNMPKDVEIPEPIGDKIYKDQGKPEK